MQTVTSANISEEYYQISETILSSFPKYRPPLNLYRLKENIGQLQLLIKKDTRLTNEQVEELAGICKEGDLFVSRDDFPIYSQHIVKQLDLVLVDSNLKEGEVADITMRALGMKLADFFDQPVQPVFDLLYQDLLVVTEYLWQDRHRLRLYMRRLSIGQYSLINHSINTFSTGLWLLCANRSEITRKEFDRVALGLLIHDVGMAKVPTFITSKATPLKPEEKEKIPPHVLVGMKIAQKLDLIYDEIKEIILLHHERLDGSGYPQKLQGNAIPKLGRLGAVADSFSAMIQDRPYAQAQAPADAARNLAAASSHYDQQLAATLAAAFVMNDFSIASPS